MLTTAIELWLGILGLFLAWKAEGVLEQLRSQVDALIRIRCGPPKT